MEKTKGGKVTGNLYSSFCLDHHWAGSIQGQGRGKFAGHDGIYLQIFNILPFLPTPSFVPRLQCLPPPTPSPNSTVHPKNDHRYVLWTSPKKPGFWPTDPNFPRAPSHSSAYSDTLRVSNTDWGTRPMKLGSWTRILLGQLGLNCTQTTCLLVKIVSHGPCYPQGYIPSDSKCWPNNLTTTTLQSWTLEQPEIQVGGKEIREGGFNLISLI